MVPYLLQAAEDTTELTRAVQSYRTTDGRSSQALPITVGDYMIAELEALYGKVFPVGQSAPPESFVVGSSVGPVQLWNKRL